MIVGGTGLYIQSVLFDYQFSEAPADAVFRKKLESGSRKRREFSIFTNDSWKLILKVAKRIHPNNIRRVIRAIEIFHCTGKTMSELQQSQHRIYCMMLQLLA